MVSALISVLLGACALIPSDPQVLSTNATKSQGTAVRKNASSETDSAAVTFTRSGGFAGKTEQWSIYLDGRVVASKGTNQVTPGDVSGLLADLVSLGIMELDDSYGKFTTCNDCFTYTISINMDNQSKTITTTDGATDAPAALGKILSLVNSFIAGVPAQDAD